MAREKLTIGGFGGLGAAVTVTTAGWLGLVAVLFAHPRTPPVVAARRRTLRGTGGSVSALDVDIRDAATVVAVPCARELGEPHQYVP
jgi:hypothetical protein